MFSFSLCEDSDFFSEIIQPENHHPAIPAPQSGVGHLGWEGEAILAGLPTIPLTQGPATGPDWEGEFQVGQST